MYKTQNALKNYFDILIKENVKEKEVRNVTIKEGSLNITTNNGKIIKTNYEKKN